MSVFPESLLLLVAAAFLVSGGLAFLLARYAPLRALTHDSTVGPQKFHTGAVSRIGGAAVIAGVVAALLIATFETWQYRLARDGFLLLACSIPAMAVGFAEDLFKRVQVKVRLFATMISAAIAYFVLDGVLDHVDVAGLDWLLRSSVLFSIALTMFAVGGIANAINIIDGYNGLAGMVSVFILTAIAWVGFQVGDTQLVALPLLAAGALIGFLLINFPRGRIFLGDGGAYFTGFIIAELCVLLVRRHPEVSPWFCFMLVAYPVCETLFSVYRKKVLRGTSPGEPDGLHFHMLVFKRVVRWRVGSRIPADRVARNSLTSPYLWALSLITIVPATIYWNDSLVLGFFAFGFTALYIWLYRRIVTFGVPRWIVLRSPRVAVLAEDEETVRSSP